MSKFFFVTAPLTVFFGQPGLTLGLMIIALVMLGLRTAMNGGAKLSLREWAQGYRAALTRNVTATVTMSVSTWLVPAGLFMTGAIDGEWIIAGAFTAYLWLGWLSNGVGQARATWRAQQLGDVREVLGLAEAQVAAVSVRQGAVGSVIVTGFPPSKILDIAVLETRLRVLWPEMELGDVSKRAITFTPCTAQTAETRSVAGASQGLVGVMAPTGSAPVGESVPSFDFSDGPATQEM